MIDVRAVCCGAVAALLATLLVACSDDPPHQAVFDKTVNVGVAPSSPGWGTQDSAGNRSGFDYDLTNWLGQRLGFNPVPVIVIARHREVDLQNGTAALVVATYSITDERKKSVGFAGPYMLSQQGIMVRESERGEYQNLSDLSGKTVCATAGSTSAEQLRELGFPVSVREREVYEECRRDLHAGQVDAISTDQLLLYGFQQIDSQVHVPPDIVFGQQERYGVGLPKGDKVKCEAVTEQLKRFITDGYWDTFFASNLPGVSVVGHKPNPNRMNPC